MPFHGRVCGLFALLPLLALATPQQDARTLQVSYSSRRVALVIGNNAYPGTPLRNAVNDAQAVARTLKDLGFQVDLATDINLRAMETAVDRFVKALRPGDVGLFYYSGHGMQIDGENFLIPTSFEAQDKAEAKYQAYSAERVHDRMQQSGVRLNIMMLDACRDNPFGRVRSGARGWAAMSAAGGSFFAFATAPGATAADNPADGNGLFTKHLLDALQRPNLKLSEVFDQVREQVYRASRGRQHPWVGSSVIGEFVFRDAGIEERRAAEVRAEVARLEAELARREAEAARTRTEQQRLESERQAEEIKARLKLEKLEQERLKQEAERRAGVEAEQRRLAQEQAGREADRKRRQQEEESRLAELRTKVEGLKPEGMSLAQARREVAALRSRVREVQQPIEAERDKALQALDYGLSAAAPDAVHRQGHVRDDGTISGAAGQAEGRA